MSRSSAPPPPAPLREITPGERARVIRTVALLLLGFVTAVGVMVAYLSAGGRAARDYGDAVLRAAQGTPALAAGPASRPCGAVFSGEVPGGVEGCTVERRGDEFEVVVRLEGNRQYRAEAPAGSAP